MPLEYEFSHPFARNLTHDQLHYTNHFCGHAAAPTAVVCVSEAARGGNPTPAGLVSARNGGRGLTAKQRRGDEVIHPTKHTRVATL